MCRFKRTSKTSVIIGVKKFSQRIFINLSAFSAVPFPWLYPKIPSNTKRKLQELIVQRTLAPRGVMLVPLSLINSALAWLRAEFAPLLGCLGLKICGPK